MELKTLFVILASSLTYELDDSCQIGGIPSMCTFVNKVTSFCFSQWGMVFEIWSCQSNSKFHLFEKLHNQFTQNLVLNMKNLNMHIVYQTFMNLWICYLFIFIYWLLQILSLNLGFGIWDSGCCFNGVNGVDQEWLSAFIYQHHGL